MPLAGHGPGLAPDPGLSRLAFREKGGQGRGALVSVADPDSHQVLFPMPPCPRVHAQGLPELVWLARVAASSFCSLESWDWRAA